MPCGRLAGAGSNQLSYRPVSQLVTATRTGVRRFVSAWGLPSLATAMVLFMAVPAEAWRAPTYDAIYHGFDTNFISTDRGGDGKVRVTAKSIEMVGAADSHPSVTLATTELAKFNVSLDANVVTANEASQPFRFGVWSPWTKSGRFIVFGPSPANLLTADTITN